MLAGDHGPDVVEAVATHGDLTLCVEGAARENMVLNHFSTTGLYRGPAHHYGVSIRQAAIEAFVKSSFKIVLAQTFPRCGATCYILPSRAMSQLFNGVNSVSLRGTFCRYLRVLVRIRNFYNSGRYLLHWQFGALCFRPFIR